MRSTLWISSCSDVPKDLQDIVYLKCFGPTPPASRFVPHSAFGVLAGNVAGATGNASAELNPSGIYGLGGGFGEGQNVADLGYEPGNL